MSGTPRSCLVYPGPDLLRVLRNAGQTGLPQTCLQCALARWLTAPDPAEPTLSVREPSEPSTLAASLSPPVLCLGILGRCGFLPPRAHVQVHSLGTHPRQVCSPSKGSAASAQRTGFSDPGWGCAGDRSRVFNGLSSQEASSSQGPRCFSQSRGFPGVAWPILAWECTASSWQVWWCDCSRNPLIHRQAGAVA